MFPQLGVGGWTPRPNTFNTLAHGIADNLATSMVADGLGTGWPGLIAPAMNHGLWAHPQTAISRERLRWWGCEFIGPAITADQGMLASAEEIVEAGVRRRGGC